MIKIFTKNGGTMQGYLETYDIISQEEFRFEFTDGSYLVVMNPNPRMVQNIKSIRDGLDALKHSEVYCATGKINLLEPPTKTFTPAPTVKGKMLNTTKS